MTFLTETRARQLLADGYTPEQLAALWRFPLEAVTARLAELGIEAA